MSDLSYIYKSSTFIREVVNDQYIQIQDAYGTVRKTLDYQEFLSAVVTTRIITVTKSDSTSFKLQFTNSDDAVNGISTLLDVIQKLKSGTYTAPNTTNSTSNNESIDYSVLYHSSNFIKKVEGVYIQIQDRLAVNVNYSIDYNNVTSVLVNNRFLSIYRGGDLPKISLQFLTNDDAQAASSIFMSTVDMLRDNTYVYNNTNLSDDIYDPDTFILEINYEDFSVRLKTSKEVETHTIVAEQVVSVYAIENFVKVKSEATDTIITLTFQDSAKAIEGAEKLREAIKTILDRTTTDPGGSDIKSYSEIFTDQSTWTLDPQVDFNISSTVLSYYEYVCPDGGTCDDSEKVKQECEGLVEYVGNEITGVLDKVIIRFNSPVSGRATIISG